MVSHAFAALIKKRAELAGKEKGFTLIELLVVVIIIGVLAAIAIPVFLNVQGGAKDSAVKSDLTTAKTAIFTSQTGNANGTLPENNGAFQLVSPAPAPDNYKVVAPATKEAPLVYSINSAKDKFCITGKSATDKDFAIDATSSVIEGTCELGVVKPKATT